jgi:hypothetical protein
MFEIIGDASEDQDAAQLAFLVPVAFHCTNTDAVANSESHVCRLLGHDYLKHSRTN